VSARLPEEFRGWPATVAAPVGPYRAVIRHHVDGDTYDALIDLGWNDYRYHPVRLLGVDTPETNRAATRDAGRAALDFVRGVMPVGSRVLLHTRADPDSFGRYLAGIRLESGEDLAAVILAAGHGTPA
jgi:endonuclease YncB( thermonuclease family)